MTEHKDAARSALNHDEQLKRLRSEVEALRGQLHEAQRLATVGTMTAMVAHEFNNILTPIINYAQLARTNPSLAAKAISHAAEGGQRAVEICSALLGVTGQPQAEPTDVNLRGLLDETLAAMARAPEKDAIELHADVPDDLTVRTRRVQFQQVLLNLLVNARAAVLERAPRDGRRIDVFARRADDGVRIEVTDNGSGISPDNLPRIFEPFFTTRSDDVPAPGHGLGLTVCREIVNELGGTITASGAPGEGATFSIRLPL